MTRFFVYRDNDRSRTGSRSHWLQTVLLSFAFVANLDVAEMESPEALLPPATSSLPEAEARADMLVADEQVAATAQRELPATQEKAQQSATVAPAVDVRAANSAPHAVESLRRSRQLDTAGEAFVDAAAKRMRAATPRHCPEAATAAPGSWYDCVLSLRKRDMTDEANAEQSRLLTKFPDFQIR